MREDEGMGHPDLKYGDTMVFLQHAESGLWLSYVTFETKKRGIGRVEEKKVGSQTRFGNKNKSAKFYFAPSQPPLLSHLILIVITMGTWSA